MDTSPRSQSGEGACYITTACWGLKVDWLPHNPCGISLSLHPSDAGGLMNGTLCSSTTVTQRI